MARAKAMLAQDPLRRWTVADALETYGIQRWGCGYFAISDQGNLIVTPRGGSALASASTSVATTTTTNGNGNGNGHANGNGNGGGAKADV